MDIDPQDIPYEIAQCHCYKTRAMTVEKSAEQILEKCHRDIAPDFTKHLRISYFIANSFDFSLFCAVDTKIDAESCRILKNPTKS